MGSISTPTATRNEAAVSRFSSTPGNMVNLQPQTGWPRLPFNPVPVPNFLRVLTRATAATEAYAAAEKALANGQLTARQREQIALAVAEINGSEYCLVAHTVNSRNAGLSEEEIGLARKAAANDRKAEAILRLTQAVVLQRGHIRDNELRAVRSAGVSEAELIEVMANIALNVFTNYLNIVSKTEVDFPLLHPEVKDSIATAHSLEVAEGRRANRKTGEVEVAPASSNSRSGGDAARRPIPTREEIRLAP